MFKELPLELNECVFEYLPVKDLVNSLNTLCIQNNKKKIHFE